jgi:syntaxin-binding protein 4
LQYDDVPEIQTVLLEEVEPLDETDFVVAAARHGALGMAVDNLARRGGESVKGRSPLDGDLTKTERGIAQDCRKTMMAVNLLLEEEGTWLQSTSPSHHVVSNKTALAPNSQLHCFHTPTATALLLHTVPSYLYIVALPFGWEAAYTPEGLKYYVDHSTQTTSWRHPGTGVDAGMLGVGFLGTTDNL